MKAKKENTMLEKSVLKRVAKSRISKPSAGTDVNEAVKNVKEIFKERRAAAEAKAREKLTVNKKEEWTLLTRPKLRRYKKMHKFTKNTGVVYLGHIPHGFYEEQMKDYFKQFGTVTRVRVARSKRTGKSRGYGYVEFLVPEVAKVAAETMNNYLMCGRLLKATYIPPEKQHPRFFCGHTWTEQNYPKLMNRKKEQLRKNAPKSNEDHIKSVARSLKKLSILRSKLQEKGINIKFLIDAGEKHNK